MVGFFKRLGYWQQYRDVVSILLLLGLSVYLMRPLFDWNTKAVMVLDPLGSWAWFYWLKESLFSFHQLPTWSPLWMNGIPFFGMVPPAGFFLVLPFYLITGDIPAAYNLATIIMFSLAGIAIYLYLKNLSQNSLASFLGAVIYVILPVHISSMVFWGIFEILCAYALIPLVLLFTDRFLDGNKQINIILLGLFFSFVLLLQIEYALVFLLFYVCYLVFALAIRKIGFHSISSLIIKNKVGIIICLLILLIPLSFYMTVLAEYDNFAHFTPSDIEAGLRLFSITHYSDVFQDKIGGDYSSSISEYYCGFLSLVILQASICFVFLEKYKRRAQLLFFLMTGFVFLILAMGKFGPLFPALTIIIPVLSDIRVPVRFYYIFALCLPVLFTLSCLSFAKLVAKVSRVPFGMRWLLKNSIPVLLIVALILDFSPYFDIYHQKVIDKEPYNKVASFLEERIKEDNLPVDNIARVIFALTGGIFVDPFSKFEQTRQGQFSIEIDQSWIPWNKYKAVADYNYYQRMFKDEESLDFYSAILSYDYIIIFTLNSLASQDPAYFDQANHMVETLNSFCSDESGTLIYKGSLDTQYYTVYLYKINNNLPGKAHFYSVNDSLLINNDHLYASDTLFKIYKEIDRQVTSDAFLEKIVTIGGEKGLPKTISSHMATVGNLYYYGDEALLLHNDPLAVQVLEAEDCKTNGWVAIDREGGWGVPTSGVAMAVADVTKVEDNYLKKSFLIGKEGNWILNISYLNSIDTGKLEIYADDKLIDTVDTYGSPLAMKTYTAELFLNQGLHEVRLVGKKSDRDITGGQKGIWVEVDTIALLNKEELPQIVTQSKALWGKIIKASISDNTSNQISNFRLSPRGISLDVNAADDGILSVAYYTNPWWRVYADGKETEVLKVNGIFTGCYIGRGQHHIEFIYAYPSPVNLFSLLPR